MARQDGVSQQRSTQPLLQMRRSIPVDLVSLGQLHSTGGHRTFRRMSSDILYRRRMPHGPEVRIRRTTAPGATPVIAVLDVDRRAGTPREKEGGTPPPLKQVEAPTEAAVVAALIPLADDDAAIAGLLRAKGLR
jgi:hypothetical protein